MFPLFGGNPCPAMLFLRLVGWLGMDGCVSECVRKGIRACTKSCWRRPEQVLATMYSVPWMKSTTSLEQAEECGLKWISWWRKQWFLASRSLDPLPSGSGLLSEAASHHRSDEENLMRRLCVCVLKPWLEVRPIEKEERNSPTNKGNDGGWCGSVVVVLLDSHPKMAIPGPLRT